MQVSYYVDGESGFVPTITFSENYSPDWAAGRQKFWSKGHERMSSLNMQTRLGWLRKFHNFRIRPHLKWRAVENPIKKSGSDVCIPRNETAWPCYFQNIIIMFCLPISTCVYLWAIYILPGSVCLFCYSQIARLILEKHKLFTDTWMQELGLKPRSFISVNA